MPEPVPDTETSAPAQIRLSATLGAGRLDVTCDGDAEPLFRLAERNNPRRAFLFVSTVLGRHIPVAPATMRAAFTALADTVPADLPGPVVFTGMAETAVGLGAGVHDAWLTQTGRADGLFLSTTRARMGPVLATFREEHSHASDHLVHLPQHAADADLLRRARSLVMVDDEASSGDTFRNLAAGLLAAGLDGIDHIHTAVLTDWSGPRGDTVAGARAGITVTRGALVRGTYRWTPAPDAPVRHLPDADVLRQGAVVPLHRSDDGRRGRSVRSRVDTPDALTQAVGPLPQRVLVLGTGEHVWEPFLMAEALEGAGHSVLFGATTRSPILPGHGIRRGLAFRDHEGLGIGNYLYNVDPGDFDRIVLCVDTALRAVDPRLIAALGCDVVVGTALHPRDRVADADVVPAKAFVAPDDCP